MTKRTKKAKADESETESEAQLMNTQSQVDETPLGAESIDGVEALESQLPDIVQSITDRLTESRTQIREYAVKDLVKMLAEDKQHNTWQLREAFSKYEETIWTALKRNVKRNASPVEVETCLRAMILFAVTVEWIQDDSVYMEIYDVFRASLHFDTRPDLASEASVLLATACILIPESEAACTQNLINVLDQHLRDVVDVESRSSLLFALALLFDSEGDISTETCQQCLVDILAQLDHNDAEVRSAAGEAIVCLAEKAMQQEDLYGWFQSVKKNVMDRMETIAQLGPHTEFIKKRDRGALKTSFREYVACVQSFPKITFPTFELQYGQHSETTVHSWLSYVRLLAMRRLYGEGLQAQVLAGNNVIRSMLEMKEIYELSVPAPEKIHVAGKPTVLSQPKREKPSARKRDKKRPTMLFH